MINAEITAGAVHGSTSVTVTCGAANGMAVMVYRGLLWLGSAQLNGGTATVTVPGLAVGDIIQASVTERGAGAGVPVLVTNPGVPTGWYKPTSVIVDGVTMTAADYLAAYGYAPLAYYDPKVLVPVIAPEVPGSLAPAPTRPAILFDLVIDKQVGKTVLTVQNVQYQSGGTLVRWAAGEAWTNVLTREYTANATITVDVRGTGDAVGLASSKTVGVTIFSPPTTTPAASDIIAASYQKGGAGYLTVYVNSLKDCETRLFGFTSTWSTVARYGSDYMNSTFSGIAPGNYTLQIRVSGDATTTNWLSIPVTL